MNFDKIKIISPKRNKRLQSGWEGFFRYYAGYPEAFARGVLASGGLRSDAVVLDPWNGSGTTTYAAAQLGLAAIGFDLNPVMVIVARSRLLAPSEADSIGPLAQYISQCAKTPQKLIEETDPLTSWFKPDTVIVLRAFERSIRRHLVGDLTLSSSGIRLDRMSGLAATFYVALFAVCTDLAAKFRTSNPTWVRRPSASEEKVRACRALIAQSFKKNLAGMALALQERARQSDLLMPKQRTCDVRLADTVNAEIVPGSADVVLTSPPYCTRIDYTAATRVELAVLAPLLATTAEELGRKMIGSTRVPNHDIVRSDSWGSTCRRFLETLYDHPSKASKGYYYKTHLDYFDKIARSIGRLAVCIKKDGAAIFVVQDSYYKNIQNNLPVIISEICENKGLKLMRREDFYFTRSMSGINPYTKTYTRRSGAIESVLCFQKV